MKLCSQLEHLTKHKRIYLFHHDEKDKFFYVWLDAPIGYIASIANWATKEGKDINNYWSKNSEYEIVHFIGKDVFTSIAYFGQPY